MPAKKATFTDAERAKRIRETAREIETSNDPKEFERAFAAATKPSENPKEPSPPRK